MALEFVTLLNDYNKKRPKISKRMLREIKYRMPSSLCNEKLNGVFLMNKRNELFDNQTYWVLT